ncbi:heterodisulfide reductase-related iron-sulfur binding cluster [Chloroflexota bacterium]
MDRKKVELNIFRYNPESDAAPHYDRVSVDIDANMPITVLDLLMKVQREQLPDLAFSYSCRSGQCGSCAVKINGVNRLACKTMAEGDALTIEPRGNSEVIRDLLVDTEGDLSKLIEQRIVYKTRTKPPNRIKHEEYRKVADIRECIECLACVSSCPVVSETPKAKGPLVRRNIAQYAFDPRISDRKSRLVKALKAGTYYCTTCRRCTESCDKDIEITDWTRQLRRAIYYDDTLTLKQPKAIPMSMDAIRDSKNLLNSPNIERAENWTWMIEDEVDIPNLINRKAKVGYFVGCVTSFKPSVDFVAQNMVKILNKIGEDFSILGPEEFCCGFPQYLAGVDESHIEHNLNAIKELGIEKLIFTCPGCYRAFKINYPERLGRDLPYEAQHATEYICDKLDSGMRFNNKVSMKLTYHDPCDLGRHAGVYEEPRRVLREAGVELVEMATNRQNATCCGMGGLLMFADMDVSNNIGKKRIQEARDTGASGLVTACPACYDQFRRNADGFNVHEITEIILKAL